MTIAKVIEQLDRLKPNAFGRAEKIEWINEIESLIYAEMVLTHEHDEAHAAFEPYTDQTDPDTELVAKAPYDRLYRHYLESKVDLYNMEMEKYNNSAQLYNEAYSAYRNWYNRVHKPLQRAEALQF